MKSTGKRRRAREMAMQMLYQFDMGQREERPVAMGDLFASFDLEGYESPEDAGGLKADPSMVPDGLAMAPAEVSPPAKRRPLTPQDRRLQNNAFEYARRLVSGTLEHGEIIDQLIRRHAENWRLERMPTIDRNILRLAIYEMLHEESVPKVVIVDEAIELAKKFGSENSGRFVNGLLDGVLQSDALAAEPTAAP